MEKKNSQKNQMRRELRINRSRLSIVQQKQASDQIVQHLLNLPIFQQSQHIALYMPFDNEVDITALISLQPKKTYYLPVITTELRLIFAQFEIGQKLVANRFGIKEPLHKHSISAENLQLVCLPLVGFDENGTRLGSGVGYYDRTFAFKRDIVSAPLLLGIGYECQKSHKLPVEAWDVPLWGIQTEAQLYRSIDKV